MLRSCLENSPPWWFCSIYLEAFVHPVRWHDTMSALTIYIWVVNGMSYLFYRNNDQWRFTLEYFKSYQVTSPEPAPYLILMLFLAFCVLWLSSQVNRVFLKWTYVYNFNRILDELCSFTLSSNWIFGILLWLLWQPIYIAFSIIY